MPNEWSRVASSERFNYKGLCLTKPADALSEGQVCVSENVRAFADSTITSRPQYSIAVAAVSNPVQSLEPTLGVFKAGTSLYNFTSPVPIATGLASTPASLTPFRPNASPSAWEYIWDAVKQVKYNPQSGVVAKTGIAEPLTAAKFAVTSSYFYSVAAQNISQYTNGNSTAANGGGSTRLSPDSIANVLQSIDGGVYYSVVPTNQAQEYGIGEDITIGGSGPNWPIFDVLPPVVGTFTIAGIYYFTGTTGKCLIVPYPTTEASQLSGSAATLQTQQVAALRRGSVINLGGEVCYVESVTTGPNGDICFETSTVNTHAVSETFTGLGAFTLCTMNGTVARATPASGQSITRATTIVTVAKGLGWTYPQNGINSNPFIIQGSPLSDQDYIHIQFSIDKPQNVIEMKFLLDVDDGTFGRNYYYTTIRPSDITQATANNLTGLGAAQLAGQRAAIDAQASGGAVGGGQQFPSGLATWSDVIIPIKSLIRVGGDRTKSLLTLKNYRFFWNVSDAISVNIALDFSVFGGFAPDSGSLNQDYRYRYRGRSSVTGAKGNPSPEPRYGVRPRRGQVTVALPTASADPQIDTWDIFRRGGANEKYTYAGSVPIANGAFIDTLTDLAIETNEELSFEHYEPFPVIGTPLSGAVNTGPVGTAVEATFFNDAPGQTLTLSQIGSLLPGNIITISQVNYTLAARPTLVYQNATVQGWLFRTVENVGVPSGAFNIREPLLAAQTTPAVWGPDVDGIFYAVGAAFQPGFIQQTNPNDPDSASDTGATELSPPNEPLINGALLNGTSIVFSSNRAWAGYPQNGKTAWKQIPVGEGLAAPFGICSDGKTIEYVTKTGISSMGGGVGESITDADLRPLFPQDGRDGVNVVRQGRTIYAPAYSLYANDFRLAVVNGYLYFDYRDSSGAYRTLWYSKRDKAWGVDSRSDAFTIHARGTVDRQLYAGSATGAVLRENQTPDFSGEVVSSWLGTKEEMFGELRATKLFGDAIVDLLPRVPVTVQPYALGSPIGNSATQALSTTRAPYVLSFGGEVEARSMGLLFSWSDQGTPSLLYLWQLSYMVQPELTMDRFTDWDSLGNTGAKWLQGFLLEADTGGVAKTLSIRDSDGKAVHVFDSPAGLGRVNHNGRSIIAYSFTTPFITHQVRLEPDSVGWKMWGIQWIYEAAPESVYTWKTQPTGHGLKGWQHVRQMELAHMSSADLTLTVTVDGYPYVYTVANSGGAFVKTLIPLKAVKGKVFQYAVTSSAAFRLWHDDLEVLVREWGAEGEYRRAQLVGGEMGAKARV